MDSKKITLTQAADGTVSVSKTESVGILDYVTTHLATDSTLVGNAKYIASGVLTLGAMVASSQLAAKRPFAFIGR